MRRPKRARWIASVVVLVSGALAPRDAGAQSVRFLTYTPAGGGLSHSTAVTLTVQSP